MIKNPLKAWRERDPAKTVPQQELAKLVGVKTMTISRWERGRHLPNKKHWADIEKATGIAPSALVEHVKTEPEKAQ